MLKNPMAKPQLDEISKKMGVSSGVIVTMLEWFVSAVYGYKKIKPIVPVIKYGLIILLVAYLLKWFGLTQGLFFMSVFK
jgi:hypothetical protein